MASFSSVERVALGKGPPVEVCEGALVQLQYLIVKATAGAFTKTWKLDKGYEYRLKSFSMMQSHATARLGFASFMLYSYIDEKFNANILHGMATPWYSCAYYEYSGDCPIIPGTLTLAGFTNEANSNVHCYILIEKRLLKR